MKKLKILFLLFCFSQSFGQTFDLIPLGVLGGGDESNLSAYLLGESGKNEFISLDAGTIRAGINEAIENEVFNVTNEEVLKNYIKGYFISHGHLDHLSGLIINSPDDSYKPIYGIEETIHTLKTKFFTNDAWINFANEGDEPQLGKYTYYRISDGERFNIEGTELSGQIFELSHVFPNKSSAVMISAKTGESVLYFGDTGADRVEGTDNLNRIWKSAVPLIKEGKLKAILIEVSFDNSRPEHLLFGHLTPNLLNEELTNLTRTAGLKDLSGLKIIITHLKPGGDNIRLIKEQLAESNPMKVEFIFPEQGELIRL